MTLMTLMGPRDETFELLESRIRKGDLDALLARWEFGRRLLAERGAQAKLPDGYLDQLCDALHNHGGRRELQNRMQFARQYPIQERVREALTEFGSWYAICQRGLGTRHRTTPLAVMEGYDALRTRIEAFLQPPRLESRLLSILPSLGRIEADELLDVSLELRARLDNDVIAPLRRVISGEMQERAQARLHTLMGEIGMLDDDEHPAAALAEGAGTAFTAL